MTQHDPQLSQLKSDFRQELERLFRLYGDHGYGENCTQYEHMAQCGWWAEQKGYDSAMAVAAFLHDVGHLIAEDQDLAGRDQWGYVHHDTLAEEWLRRWGFPEEVCQSVGMHVQAKKYLVTAQPGYAEGLSKASRTTLEQQGGPFSDEECREFEKLPGFQNAIRLRELDELGKAEEFELPDLQYWLDASCKLLAM
ncbi:HD family phosphohydrolase [Hahella sp. CCB-MM4]|uniref:phosphonate degradation HD-domain oxygenase n=1 Tax=Hahella sp. (strain CCB-MM4) TaxID=1926491 RepID=UPI000B9C076B|nr:phosphonate degradation HD-domain oxygenase [Hahella sp. CCB-MM4]OZG70959.1 HD family phosphohydrolase [Hahella sp. CCB-MM4]